MTYIELNSLNKIIERIGAQPKGPVQKFFTNTCALHMDKYVPARDLILAGTVVQDGVINEANVTEDTITYAQPYARYQYNGERQDGSHKIVNRTLDKHPLATSYWDRHMVTAEIDDVVDEVQDEMRRRSNG